MSKILPHKIKGERLINTMHGINNNLNFIRFIAAICVIFSHSFILTTGSNTKEWISIITNRQMTGGSVAVALFFFVGGLLVAKSIDGNKNGKSYFFKRCIRILPLLNVICVLSVFIIGPLFTTYELKDYFTDIDTYKYLLNGVFILRHRLPGVFVDNIYTQTVNGSLWTLPVEFLCYIIVYILYKLKLLKHNSFYITIPIALVFELSIYYVAKITGIGIIAEIIRPTLLFYIGMMYYVYRNKIVLRFEWAVVALIGLVITNYLHILSSIGMLLFYPYLIIYLCYGLIQVNSKFSKLGNYSYAIYLCGFPIQQMLISIYGEMNTYLNAGISILIAIFFGIILTDVIEKSIVESITKIRIARRS